MMKISSSLKALIIIAMTTVLLLVAAGCQSAEKANAPSQSAAAQETPSASPADTSMDVSGDTSTDKPVETPSAASSTPSATAQPAGSSTAQPTATPAASPAPNPTQTPTSNPAGSPSPKPTSNQTAAPNPTPAPAAKNYAVEIKQFAFTPDVITVEVNSTITFTNKDDVQHTVTAKDGSFNSGLLDTNKSFTIKFTKAGTYGIYCEPHKFMTATIVVK